LVHAAPVALVEGEGIFGGNPAVGAVPGELAQLRPGVEIKNPENLRTYSAVSSAFTPGATPDDVFAITGAANIVAKITGLRRMIAEKNLQTLIEVDGGVSVKNIAEISAAGADVFVAGSAIFESPDYAAAIRGLRAGMIR